VRPLPPFTFSFAFERLPLQTYLDHSRSSTPPTPSHGTIRLTFSPFFVFFIRDSRKISTDPHPAYLSSIAESRRRPASLGIARVPTGSSRKRKTLFSSPLFAFSCFFPLDSLLDVRLSLCSKVPLCLLHFFPLPLSLIAVFILPLSPWTIRTMFSSLPLSLSLLPFVLPSVLVLDMSANEHPPTDNPIPSSPTSVASSHDSSSWPLLNVGSSSNSELNASASPVLSAEQAPLPPSPTSPSTPAVSNELPLPPPSEDTSDDATTPSSAAKDDEDIHAELAEEPVWPSWSRSRSPSPIEQGMSPVDEGKGVKEVEVLEATNEKEDEARCVEREDVAVDKKEQSGEQELLAEEKVAEEVRPFLFFRSLVYLLPY
jgi:hypothetical protein